MKNFMILRIYLLWKLFPAPARHIDVYKKKCKQKYVYKGTEILEGQYSLQNPQNTL